jgi:tetratricopeptide (TPR) repeat protein
MIDTAQQHITTLEKKVGTDAKSPLFAQLAHYYLEAKRAQDALRVCDAGLANFPFYTTGHLIKGKALVALNMQAEARREFEFVLDFLPQNETLMNLLAQMPPAVGETLTLAPPQEAPRKIISPQPPPPPKVEIPYPVSAPPKVPASEEPPFSFGGFEQAAPVQQPEPTPIALPTQNFFEELTQVPPATPTEDTLGFGVNAPPVETPTTFATSPFSEFNFPQPEPIIPTASTELSKGFEFTPPTSDIDLSMTSALPKEESFEHYTSRRTKELTGENTVSMEDYLSTKPPVKPQEVAMPLDFTLTTVEPMPQEFTLPKTESIPTGVQDKIEELTNKLQGAGKITPVINFAQKETSAASEQDTPAGMGFVTPTLAEIYAKQGWFDDAIKAYKTLARNKPAEKERFEKRIAELEELKKKAGG